MTEIEKEILIMKMIDTPESLTDEEIEIILQDRELRDIYEASSGLSGAFLGDRKFDAASEWEIFRKKLPAGYVVWRRVLKMVAVFAGIIIFSGILMKTIDFRSSKDSDSNLVSEIRADDMDLEEYLRIQKARIDNDIAMLTAEIYKDYYEILINDPRFDNEESEELERDMIILTTP